MRSDSRTVCGCSNDAPPAPPDGGSAFPQDAAHATHTHIVLIERRALVRECLARCIRAVPGHLVTAFASLASWLDASEKVHASLVVLCLPGGRGDAEQREFDELARAAKVLPTVVMSDAEDLDCVRAAIDKGARGFIPTSLSIEVVIEALRLVRAGGVFVPASSLVPALRASSAPAPVGREGNGVFTARQAAVVEALRKGKANKIIAHELNMRESTVKVHVRNIMKKLSAKNRTEVALMASRLLQEPPATDQLLAGGTNGRGLERSQGVASNN